MTENKKNNNRTTLLLLVAVFALPVVLAVLALQGNWFNKASTNKGELLHPPVEMGELLRADTPQWRLLYVLPAQCDIACKNALYSISQVWQASGREKDRVQATVVTTENSDMAMISQLNSDGQVTVLTLKQAELLKGFGSQSLSHVFISDTLGNVILRYPLSEEKQQAVMLGKDMLSDLKKLLKLSRIG